MHQWDQIVLDLNFVGDVGCGRRAPGGVVETPDGIGRFEGQDEVLFNTVVKVIVVFVQPDHGQLLPPANQFLFPIEN